MPGRNDGHQMEYSQITENIFIGSDLCRGPVCPVHSVEFKRLGINCEINMEVERHEDPTPGVDAYIWIPVDDGAAPSLIQLMIGTSALNQMIEVGSKVYVHCKNGHGRSPTMVAAYLIRYKGMNCEDAEDLVKSKRLEIHIEDVQRKALQDFKDSLN